MCFCVNLSFYFSRINTEQGRCYEYQCNPCLWRESQLHTWSPLIRVFTMLLLEPNVPSFLGKEHLQHLLRSEMPYLFIYLFSILLQLCTLPREDGIGGIFNLLVNYVPSHFICVSGCVLSLLVLLSHVSTSLRKN